MKIGYARVSTLQNQTFEIQDRAILAAGVEPENVYRDRVSGAKTARPGLDHCLKMLRPGDTLYVYKLDRLARSVGHLLSLADDFEKKGIDLVSVTDPGIDTTTAIGKLVFTIMGAMAEFERSLIRERTMAGMVAAREQGRIGGRRPALSRDQIVELQKIFLGSGKTRKEVAAAMGIPRTTVYKYLNPDSSLTELAERILKAGEKLEREEAN